MKSGGSDVDVIHLRLKSLQEAPSMPDNLARFEDCLAANPKHRTNSETRFWVYIGSTKNVLLYIASGRTFSHL